MIVLPPEPGLEEPTKTRRSIVIPSLCEADRIGEGLSRLLLDADRDTEVIVVISGPVDGSEEEIAKHAGGAWIKILRFPGKLGKGRAILYGIAAAVGETLIYTDADAPFEPGGMAQLLEVVESGEADVAIASKWLGRPLGDPRQPTYRRIGGRLFWLAATTALGLPYQDTQAGLKVFSRRVLPFIQGDFICDGFDVDIEMLLRFQLAGLRVVEVPLEIHSSTGRSSVKLSHVPGVFGRLFRLRAWLDDQGGRLEPVSPEEFPSADEVAEASRDMPAMELRGSWPPSGDQKTGKGPC